MCYYFSKSKSASIAKERYIEDEKKLETRNEDEQDGKLEEKNAADKKDSAHVF